MEQTQQVKVAPKRCANCQKSCVDVCEEVKAKHKNLVQQIHVFHKAQVALAYGNPCNEVETEGIENLFVEKEMPAESVPQKRVAKIFTATQAPALQEKQSSFQYADMNSLLVELEKDLPPLPVKKLSLNDHATRLMDLIKRGSAEAAALSKNESTQAAFNNLDTTIGLLQDKNNEFLDAYKKAAESEKSDTACLRLALLVPTALKAALKLAEKEPLASYLLDISNPFNSYMNEISLLETVLNKKK